VHLNVRDIEVHKKLWVEHFGGVVVQKGPLVAVKLPGMLIAPARPSHRRFPGNRHGSFRFQGAQPAEVLQAWARRRLPGRAEIHRRRGLPRTRI
jgi:hypothetical protein